MRFPAFILLIILHLMPAASGQSAAELARDGRYAEAARSYLIES